MLLEWMAAVELQTRGNIKAIMPVIIGDEDGSDFQWSLAQQLPKDEHVLTTNNCRLHLERERPLTTGSNSLAKTAEVVQDVSAGADNGVSVSGVVAAVMRFQGIIVP